MSSGINGYGTDTDLNTIMKRIGRLKMFIRRNQMTLAHSLSTTILADLTAQNVTIQAATSAITLPVNPVLPIRDSEYQTSNT